jgi:hypothetical protein
MAPSTNGAPGTTSWAECAKEMEGFSLGFNEDSESERRRG